jgi:hypothetical protein
MVLGVSHEAMNRLARSTLAGSFHQRLIADGCGTTATARHPIPMLSQSGGNSDQYPLGLKQNHSQGGNVSGLRHVLTPKAADTRVPMHTIGTRRGVSRHKLAATSSAWR